MANNITAAEVRAAGGWDSNDISDTDLARDMYIPLGDKWLHNLLGQTYTEYAAADSDGYKTGLVKAAEIYFVAYLVASRPPKEAFTAGPVSGKGISANDIKTSAEWLLKQCKKFLSDAGVRYESWGATYAGGDDYHPLDADGTQIDLGVAHDSSEKPLDFLGVDAD